MVGHVASTEKRDLEANAAVAERLDPLLERAASQLEAETRARPTPTLTPAQWAAFDRFVRTGYSPRGKTGAALMEAGLLSKTTFGYTRMPFANEILRRRREAEK